MTRTQDSCSNDLRANLDGLLAKLGQGQFLEAMDAYLADDVVLQEGDGEPKTGKEFCMEFEAEFLQNVAAFGRYEATSIAVAGDKTFYEGVMEFTQKDGVEVSVKQCVVDTWKDGKIVHERFYHA